MEAGEKPEAALQREIKEELDADISVENLLKTVECDYPKFHLTMHCYWCRLKSESMHLNEHEAARWLSADNMESVRWLPADEELLPQIREALK